MWRDLLIIGIALLKGVKESCGRRQGLYHSQETGHADLEPYFDLSGIRSVRNVSAVEGKTATLSCTVRNLGDRRGSDPLQDHERGSDYQREMSAALYFDGRIL